MRAKRRGGLIRLDLAANEVGLLGSLFDEVEPLLGGANPADPVVQRLFPDGYRDDSAAALEYSGLVRESLASERTERLQQCRAELPADGGRIELDAEAADRWIRVLNDVRLALGTRLGVTEADDLDETVPAVSIYHWLGAVQETLVQTLT